MKKIWVSLMVFLFFVAFSACNNHRDTTTVKNGTYKLGQTETDAVVSPYITISDENISFSYDALSSYWPYGTYTVEDGVLTMTTYDERYKYVFRLDDDKLIFQKKESSSVRVIDSRFGAEITDNAEFILEDNENEN
ncbi:MAG TPA: hypothetical protein GXX75_07560 [Clostridiales bacterium]|nr:hypothetical protein [Clostridiales bacterium]